MITLIAGTNRKSSKSSVMAHCLAGIYAKMGIENEVLELEQLPRRLSPQKPTLKSHRKWRPLPAGFSIRQASSWSLPNTTGA